MDTEQILEALRQERNRIDAAINALNGGQASTPARGRRGTRRMSAESKAKIAAAQRARWAKVKAAQKKK